MAVDGAASFHENGCAEGTLDCGSSSYRFSSSALCPCAVRIEGAKRQLLLPQSKTLRAFSSSVVRSRRMSVCAERLRFPWTLYVLKPCYAESQPSPPKGRGNEFTRPGHDRRNRPVWTPARRTTAPPRCRRTPAWQERRFSMLLPWPRRTCRFPRAWCRCWATPGGTDNQKPGWAVPRRPAERR